MSFLFVALGGAIGAMGRYAISLQNRNLVATGQNIVRLRKAAGLSVKDLQDIVGFATPQAIYKWQKGAAMPTIDNLVVLAMVFRVKMDDIIVVDAAADLMDVLMRSA